MSQLLNLGNFITAGSDPYQFYNFRERALSDGATILSDTQVSEEIKRLRSLGLFSKFSALYTPAVRNTSKLYSIISADGDATVTRGSVKNIIDADGVLEQIASNVTPSSFGTGGWGALVEGARTNLLLRSEEFDNAYWTKNNSTVTNNAIIAPDGTTTADKIVASVGTFNSNVGRQFVTISATAQTLSVFLKQDEFTWARLRLFDRRNNVGYSLFANLATGQLGAMPSGASGTIAPASNGFYRITLSLPAIVGALNECDVFIGPATSDGVVDVTSDGTSGIFIWGAQLEAGSFASSYMKTEGATFTRNADVITKTGASDLIGQTSGWIYAEVDIKMSPPRTILSISSGVSNNRIEMNITADEKIRFFQLGSEFRPADSSPQISGVYKILGVYSESFTNLYINGALSASMGGSVPLESLTKIVIGGRFDERNQDILNDTIYCTGLGKGTLTEAEAIALTT